MKPRRWQHVALGLLLALVFLCSSCSTIHLEGGLPLRATINADCAPWDGMAFTLSIPQGPGTSIDISIWQPPEIESPITFLFPDTSGRVGTAVYRTASGTSESVRGSVSFDGVDTGQQVVNGTFVFSSESGVQLAGKFAASWGNTRALCG